MAAQPAIAIIVDAEIEPDRVEEFLKVIEADAKGSREEPGCLRFDVLRASDTRFFFYEGELATPSHSLIHRSYFFGRVSCSQPT